MKLDEIYIADTTDHHDFHIEHLENGRLGGSVSPNCMSNPAEEFRRFGAKLFNPSYFLNPTFQLHTALDRLTYRR